MAKKVTLFWFRRDLRLEDNAGLLKALKSEAPVVPIFIFDPTILSKLEDTKDARVSFLHERLQALKNQLQDKINLLSTKYAIPSELICSSKNLVKLVKGDNTLSIHSGWRSELFKP